MEHDLNSVDRPTTLIDAGGIDPIDELHRIDSEAFSPRWRLGRLGLAESVTATNRSVVFRVAADGDCVGFAIVGVALGAGYLQRLAVSPAARGRGLGSDLVRASLRWARGHGARSMLVNTQIGQRRARPRSIAGSGFNDVPGGLLLFKYAPARGDRVVPPPLPPRYRLEVRLGRDQDIEEWLATDLNLDRPVLIRILGPDASEKRRHEFLTTVRAAAAVIHPHLEPIYAAEEVAGGAYAVSEWSGGLTLESRLAGGNTLDPLGIRRQRRRSGRSAGRPP